MKHVNTHTHTHTHTSKQAHKLGEAALALVRWLIFRFNKFNLRNPTRDGVQ